MSDRESNRDAIARRLLEIATYNELTGAGAPVPRPDPRGQDYRGTQIRNQEIVDYNRLVPGAGVPIPYADPRGEDFRAAQRSDIPPLSGAMYPPPGVEEEFYARKGRY